MMAYERSKSAQDNFDKFIHQIQFAQSAGAVEYTDCSSAEG